MSSSTLLHPWRGGRYSEPCRVAAYEIGNSNPVSAQPRAGCWTRRAGIHGASSSAILEANPALSPVPLQVSPGLTGEHIITIGLYHPRDLLGRVYCRVAGEEHYTHVTTLRRDASFEQVTIGVADLTGRAVELASFDGRAWLDFVEFTPVHAKTVPAPTAELLGFLDFAVDAHASKPAGSEAASAVRRHVEAGFTMIAWKAFAVRCEYWTRVGERRGFEDIPGTTGPSVGELLKQYDTMRQAVDEAKRLGVPILGWARISNEMSKPAPHQFSAATPFHLSHPEMVQRRHDGQPTSRLSLAYPEVRRHKAEILAEIAGYGVDGILIDTLRHPPMALYDQPLIDLFMNQGGEDPRVMLGDGSPEWLRFRSRHAFTQFLIEVRELIQVELGRRVPIYVRILDQPWANLVAGCDVEDWLARELVDGLIAAPWCAQADDYPETLDVGPYKKLARGRTRVFGQVWRYGSMAQAMELARQVYASGGEGVAVYDSQLAVTKPGCRENLWRLALGGPALEAADPLPLGRSTLTP